jgi:hypothetical protein
MKVDFLRRGAHDSRKTARSRNLISRGRSINSDYQMFAMAGFALRFSEMNAISATVPSSIRGAYRDRHGR